MQKQGGNEAFGGANRRFQVDQATGQNRSLLKGFPDRDDPQRACQQGPVVDHPLPSPKRWGHGALFTHCEDGGAPGAHGLPSGRTA